jgi:hypothetical protein
MENVNVREKLQAAFDEFLATHKELSNKRIKDKISKSINQPGNKYKYSNKTQKNSILTK